MAEPATDWDSWRAAVRERAQGDLRPRAQEVARAARERVERLQEVQQDMRAVRETAMSPRREVSVTATWGGAVVDVSFPTGAHKRLPAGELSKLVVATVGEAQRKVVAAAAEVLAPTLPAGLDATALLSGDVDLTRLAPSSGAPSPLARLLVSEG